jgi:hypothetical protein
VSRVLTFFVRFVVFVVKAFVVAFLALFAPSR